MSESIAALQKAFEDALSDFKSHPNASKLEVRNKAEQSLATAVRDSRSGRSASIITEEN